MYVSELNPGMLLKPVDGLKYFIQESRDSNLPKLRLAPDVIVNMMAAVDYNELQHPVMYLGKTKKDKTDRGFLRTAMVDGLVVFIEGKEFRNLNPVFD